MKKVERTMQHFPVSSRTEARTIAWATFSGVFDLRPEFFHVSAKSLNVDVGVKNGATALTPIPRPRATCCDARSRPVSPCFDVMYAPTPVVPKYPDVEVTKTTDPL